MLKHATICRISRAQEMLREQWNEQNPAYNQQQQQIDSFDVADQAHISADYDDLIKNTNGNQPPTSPIDSNRPRMSSGISLSCSSSPTPSLVTTPTSRLTPLSSAPSSVFSSPSKPNSSHASTTATLTTTTARPSVYRSTSDSMIRIFAQTLSQEVEYVTLHLNAQTKSQQIIKTLLRKFRLKHRDPNLFYLTLERWIRKDGIKFKSVMLLGDDACPLQLQQCCSNPPHNDIKFTLQMRTGALMKIFCSDVCSSTKYKCLSLSSQTTVEETIGLMLHCLNLTIDCDSKQGNNSNDTITQTLTTTHAISHHNHHRQASSPSSTGSSSSSASSTSSSSGIESDLMNHNTLPRKNISVINQHNQHKVDGRLDAYSRTSSVTSISSASNVSNTSCSQSFSDHYCLVVECENTNYKRVLEADDFLVEVYQSLLDEARDEPKQTVAIAENEFRSTRSASSIPSMKQQQQQQPDQWFVIKLKRRDDLSHHSVKFANPRQNMPLPPIPPSLAQFSNANDLQFFVSTTQIEVNHHQRRLGSNHPNSPALTTTPSMDSAAHGQNENRLGVSVGDNLISPMNASSAIATARSRPTNCHQRQLSAIVSSGNDKMPPPPETLVWLPPVRPRRRNLSNASSTFGRPQNGLATGVACNRRRYDPAQLADDLNQLNFGASGSVEPAAHEFQMETDKSTSDRSMESKPVIEQAGSSEGTPVAKERS